MARLDGAPGRVKMLLGDGMTIVVRGPAGIGKSTLVHRALRGELYALGQSLDPLRDLPYHPVAHALGRAFEGPAVDVAADVAAELGDRTLLIEDAHWSDDATLDVLVLLAGRVPVVVTSRVGLALDRHPRVEVVEVPPLTPPAARALARRLHPTLDLNSRSRVVELAGGNPLLIEQLVAGDAVSPTLRDAVRTRVAALPAVTIEQLAVLALHGRPLPRELVAVAGAADAASAGALVIEGTEGVSLAHALLADAVVELIDDDVRRRIHARLAEVCDDADGARHLLAAGDHVGAAERAERAAETSTTAAAAQLLALAVDARGDTADVRLRLDAAAALIAANRPATAEAIVAPLDGSRRTHPGRSRVVPLAGGVARRRRDRCGEPLRAGPRSGPPLRHGDRDPPAHRTGHPAGADPARGSDRDRRCPRGVDRSGTRRRRSGEGTQPARAGPRPQRPSRLGGALSRGGRAGPRDGDVEQELTAMYWLISAYGFYGPIRRAIDVGAELTERTAQLGLRRLHHHFVGAQVVQVLGTGTGSDDHVSAAKRLLADDPLFRNRAQVDLALAIGLLDRGDADAAGGTLAAARRFVRNDEDRSLLCVGQAELAWVARRPRRFDGGARRARDVRARVLRDERVRRERSDPHAALR